MYNENTDMERCKLHSNSLYINGTSKLSTTMFNNSAPESLFRPCLSSLLLQATPNTSQLTDLNLFPRAFTTNHKFKGQLYSVDVDW
jgi:hypothetical protein